MSENEDRLTNAMESWKARHDRLRDAVLESGVAIQIAGGCDMSPPTLYVGTDFTKTLKDAVAERIELKRQEKDYERVARQFAEVGEILGQGADSLPTTARFIVAERDQLRRDLESVQDSLDEQHEVVVPHVAASLPEPDATNPDHLRFAAAVVFKLSEAWAIKPEEPIHHPWTAEDIKSEADRLDAARSAERERERDIKAVATALADSHKLVNAQGWIGWAEVAVDALDALRGGGRGE
ncbi:hypothetical protein SEA_PHORBESPHLOWER_54 [Gordonia phage PhorbesPhlower]|nr:hypothetical protein SEA_PHORBESPHLOWER_54 [Gordonia phage PhorbesPhlower]